MAKLKTKQKYKKFIVALSSTGMKYIVLVWVGENIELVVS